MMISTKGRYALRVMLELVEHEGDGFTPLKDIADRQEISLKYLESIMTILSKQHLVDGASGKKGGYRLCRKPEEYSVGEILRLTEGTLAPVSCLQYGAQPCERADMCYMLPVWQGLEDLINQYFDNMTLADIYQNARKSGCGKTPDESNRTEERRT